MKELTYADSGVDRNLRKKSKKALKALQTTFGLSKKGKVIILPYGKALQIGSGQVLILEIEGVGTKVLLPQLAAWLHKLPLAELVGDYHTIGIDGVAMVVNDYLRASGLGPDAIADNVHTEKSEPLFVEQIIEGIVAGAVKSECPVIGGEIGDVEDIIKGIIVGIGFDMVVAASGVVPEEYLIHGDDIKPGDKVIGLNSSGAHSNGYSLLRKILFKQWGGKYEPFVIPKGFDREIIYEALEPTVIYVKPVSRIVHDYVLKGIVHITGDAYLKFGNLMRSSPGIGFEFSGFNPHPIFEFIRATAREARHNITDEEMFKTFNMGFGFAIVVGNNDTDSVIDIAEANGTAAQVMGEVTDSGRIFVSYQGRRFELMEN